MRIDSCDRSTLIKHYLLDKIPELYYFRSGKASPDNRDPCCWVETTQYALGKHFAFEYDGYIELYNIGYIKDVVYDQLMTQRNQSPITEMITDHDSLRLLTNSIVKFEDHPEEILDYQTMYVQY